MLSVDCGVIEYVLLLSLAFLSIEITALLEKPSFKGLEVIKATSILGVVFYCLVFAYGFYLSLHKLNGAMEVLTVATLMVLSLSKIISCCRQLQKND